MTVDPNEVLRFLLELVGLAVYGYWGLSTADGTLAIALAVGLPLLVATVWGALRVPGDPGTAPVAIPGPVRLVLEVVVFGLAALALADVGQPILGAAFVALVLVHYALAGERVEWLLRGDDERAI